VAAVIISATHTQSMSADKKNTDRFACHRLLNLLLQDYSVQLQRTGCSRGCCEHHLLTNTKSISRQKQHRPLCLSLQDYSVQPLDIGFASGEDRLLLWLPMTITHVIHDHSPLSNWKTPEDALKDADATIVVLVSQSIKQSITFLVLGTQQGGQQTTNENQHILALKW